MIPFNKPYFTGSELQYISDAVNLGKISGNGVFTQKSQLFFEERYGFEKCLLTSSCTDALEMAAILADIKEGDQVIIPSFTFVSSANAFVLRGAEIVFADSESTTPNLDIKEVEKLITAKTKAIVVVHYGGVACDMAPIMKMAEQHNILVIEDAAQSIDSYYREKPLGGIGHFGCFSFHETKNIISGEGGMLTINDKRFLKRAEIIWEKGTNRSAFWRGEVDKYNWMDMGSSFLPSEVIAAVLFAQLEHLDGIQQKRKALWHAYQVGLKHLEEKGLIRLPFVPDYASNNAHLFYILCKSINERSLLLEYLKKNGIYAVFHYISLHKSPFYAMRHGKRELPFSDSYSDCLIRLPLYYELTEKEVEKIIECVHSFFNKR